MTTSRVLVVEDEAAVRQSVARLLQGVNREVDVAGSVSRAIAMLREGTYDLLVAGLRLPDGDGLELLRRARALDPAIETILVAVPGDMRLAADALAQKDGAGTGPGTRADAGDTDEVPMVSVRIGTPLEDVERLLIRETLRSTGGNKRRAAHMLGIATRTIYRKL